jgi:hypothetical protein
MPQRVRSCSKLNWQPICAEASPAAARKQVELMSSDDDRVVFMATEAVLNRGAGKPRDHSNEQTNRVDLSVLSAEEREALAALLRKAMGMPGAWLLRW